MNLPSFNAEASLYRVSTHYRLASGPAGQTDIQVILAQLGTSAILRTPILCNGDCPPPICHIHCGPCHKDSTGACVRTCTTFGTGCEDPGTFTSPCSATACQPICLVTCDTGSCSCGGYPNCAPTGMKTCHDCHGNPAPSQPC